MLFAMHHLGYDESLSNPKVIKYKSTCAGSYYVVGGYIRLAVNHALQLQTCTIIILR
jgi:hypothetical protein